MLIPREEIEKYLDHGRLGAKMRNGNTWRARRNGQTKRWKKDANRFRIPIKCGLRSCTHITEESLVTIDGKQYLNPDWFEFME